MFAWLSALDSTFYHGINEGIFILLFLYLSNADKFRNPIGRMKKLFSILLLLTVIPITLYSQRKFHKTDLAADLDTLYLHINKIHPDAFTRVSQQEFDAMFSEIKESLPKSLTKLEFYPYVARIVALAGDLHSDVSFPMNDFLDKKPCVFPAYIRISPEDMSMTVKNSPGNQIPSGSTILSINGKSANEIVNALSSYIPAETPVYLASRLTDGFHEYYNYIDPSDVYFVEYGYEGKIYKKEVKGGKIKVRKQNGNKKTDQAQERNLSFTETSSGTVLFDIRKFDSRQRYVTDSLFLYLKNNGTENLIIDVRDNYGGMGDMAYDILSYISPAEYRLNDTRTYRFSDLSRHYNIRYYGKDTVRNTTGVYNYVYTEPEEMTQPREDSSKFHGRVFLLVNNGSMSTSVFLAHGIKHYKLGTIIGEETGSSLYSFFDPIKFTLPVTGLNYTLSTAKMSQFPVEKYKGHGVVPDIEIPSKQSMDKAMELILQRPGKP